MDRVAHRLPERRIGEDLLVKAQADELGGTPGDRPVEGADDGLDQGDQEDEAEIGERGEHEEQPGPALAIRVGTGRDEPQQAEHRSYFNPRTLQVGTGRASPLNVTGPTSSASIMSSTAAATLAEIRICPPRASPQSRAARFVTVPIAP